MSESSVRHPIEDVTRNRRQYHVSVAPNPNIRGRRIENSEPEEISNDHDCDLEAPMHDRSLSSIANVDDEQFPMSTFSGSKPLLKVSSSAAWNQNSERPKRFRSLLKWKAEILLTIVIGVLFCALCLTLASRHNQPLPQWPLKITINSLLSSYAIALKSAILYIVTQGLGQLKWLWYTKSRSLTHFNIFDAASRGPLGSLQMLWYLRFQSVIASVGAFIVIVSLVMDPFVQQIVQPFPCNISDSSLRSSIPRTNYFDFRGGHIAAGIDGIDPGVRGAIEAVLFSRSSITIPFDCPTGNCTFGDIYQSIGYCSSCKNVTSNLVINCSTLNPNITYPGGASGQNCTYELPNFTEDSSLQFATFGYPSGYDLITSGVSQVDGSIGLIWDSTEVQAAQCSLYPCIKSYNGTIGGGKLTESLVSEISIEGSTAGTVVWLKCSSDRQKEILREQGYNITSGMEWLPYNGTNVTSFLMMSLDQLVLQPGNAIPPQCMYSIHPLSASSISYFLSDYFSGTLRTKGIDPESLQDQPAGPAQLETLYESAYTGFDTLITNFKNISDSITAYIRQNGNTSLSAPAQGIVFQTQTCTHIRWEWISLPGFLVAATILFLFTTIFSTSTQCIGSDWKLSQYPLLFHGLDQDILDRARNLNDLKDMEASAKRLYVRMIKRDQTLKLVEAH